MLTQKGSEHQQVVNEVREEVRKGAHDYQDSDDASLAGIKGEEWLLYGSDPAPGFVHIDPILVDQPTNLVGGLCRGRSIEDNFCYIYTR